MMMDDMALSGPNGPREASVYESIREDIIEGRLPPNSRLKVSELSGRFGTSTNPVREALHQLRGEGFVVISPNRGARVRPIDEDFVRDIVEIEILIEPYLTRAYVDIVTPPEIAELVDIQRAIDANNFADPQLHAELDSAFHRRMYDRHYNRHAVTLWWNHREILSAIGRRFPVSMSRRVAILQEHHELLAHIRAQDPEGAADAIRRHVEGAGRHVMEQLRAHRRTNP
jgi:DNA-binding GntR family transcriptional regulator